LFKQSFCPFSLAIVLSVLRFTDSDYLFGIFKLFLYEDHVLIGNPRWPPLHDMLLTQDPDRMGKYRNILSETTELIEPKPYMDVLWMNLLFSAIPYSSLRFTDSDYLFGIFKLFLYEDHYLVSQRKQ
jgi:hypothetical protein